MREELIKFNLGMFAFSLVFTLFWFIRPAFRYAVFPDPLILVSILTQYIFIPVLLFAVSYFIGKKIVWKYGLSSVIIPLFLGSLVGSIVFFGYSYIYYLSLYVADSTLLLHQFLMLVSIGLQIFFIGFTAMTIGILRRAR